MAVGAATISLLFLIYYFVRSTGANQHLDLDYSTEYARRQAIATATLDIESDPEILWHTLTDMANYKTWYPWVHRLRVTNENTKRWAHKHSLLKYKMEVGSRFKIQPFFGAPYNSCRFVSIDPPNKLAMEMRFFPLNRELVTFNLHPYKNCVEVTYTATSNGLLNFLTTAMFSWRGKEVLRNLNNIMPKVDYEKDIAEDAVKVPQFVFDDSFINALIAKAYSDGTDILNSISEKVVRGKAKSGLIKAKRVGKPPNTTPDATQAVNQFLSGDAPQVGVASPSAPAVEVPEEIRINQYILRGLDGDTDIINSINDRVFRSKVKSALTKAKRTGERPEVPPDTLPLGAEPAVAPSIPTQKTDEGTLINTYVAKAMGGDEEAISSIKDRVLRSKVKSALVKAKRTGIMPEVSETSDQPLAPETQEEASPTPPAGSDGPETVVDQAVRAALEGNMDLINGLGDRVLRAKAKSALAKAKRAQG